MQYFFEKSYGSCRRQIRLHSAVEPPDEEGGCVIMALAKRKIGTEIRIWFGNAAIQHRFKVEKRCRAGHPIFPAVRAARVFAP